MAKRGFVIAKLGLSSSPIAPSDLAIRDFRLKTELNTPSAYCGDIEIPSNLVTLQSGISNRHSRTKGDTINENVYSEGLGNLFIILVLLLLMFSTPVSATSIDDEFKKIANYAGEYETGNIDYVQLLVYSSSVREKMNEILGATGREMGGVLKQEQIKKILGEALEETKWVWSEGENKEIRLDNPAPVWKKIIFDGRKIQIRLNAWPTIFSKRDIEGENKNKNLEDLEGKLIYRLNFDIEFKKPEEQLNIQGKIDNIKAFAQTFNLNPSSGNAEALAKESVNAERTFESYFKQSGEKCEDVMSSIFGTENKRQTQQLLVQESSFCEGDNFEVIARLEMCDE